jgi:hypothetical protein
VVPADELIAHAASLRAEADEVLSKRPVPGLNVQLGLKMQDKDLDTVTKQWVYKGKGELLKGEFRLHLRTVGLDVSSADADALFSTWDDDGGGSLDQKACGSACSEREEPRALAYSRALWHCSVVHRSCAKRFS